MPKTDETPYQVQQAKIAIAKGGIIGVGPGNSEAKNFMPHPYSDMIYAVILEEYGLIGGAIIIFIYLVFLVTMYQVIQKMSLCFWCLPGSGFKLYAGYSSNGKYGGCG